MEVLITGVALTVGLRVFTRAYVVGNMWADDWAMVAAMVSYSELDDQL